MAYVSPYQKWANGPSKSQNYFPILGWDQQTANASALAALGFNGLMDTNNEGTNFSATDLSRLASAGMNAVVHRTSQVLALSGDPNYGVIVGWNPGPDEPDNSQPGGSGGLQGFVLPATQITTYNTIVGADSTRPVVMNLGQGIADENWIGHGSGQPNNTGGAFLQDYYYQYTQATDICLFDVYPVSNWSDPSTHQPDQDRTDLLWKHYTGTRRIRDFSGGKKPIWRHLECSYISSTATPRARISLSLLRSQIWLNIIGGANGLVYFLHEFTPTGAFTTDCVLIQNGNPVWTSENYANYASQITINNKEVASLAHVINSPEINGLATVTSNDPNTPIALSARKIARTGYLFSVGLRNNAGAVGTFNVHGLQPGSQIAVLNEGRYITAGNETFTDTFANPYDVHLYEFPLHG